MYPLSLVARTEAKGSIEKKSSVNLQPETTLIQHPNILPLIHPRLPLKMQSPPLRYLPHQETIT